MTMVLAHRVRRRQAVAQARAQLLDQRQAFGRYGGHEGIVLGLRRASPLRGSEGFAPSALRGPLGFASRTAARRRVSGRTRSVVIESTVRSVAWLLTATAALLLSGDETRAQRRYIDGVFVASPSGPVELIAYAEPDGTGRLHLTNGAMDDVPPIRAGSRVLVSLPGWKPAGAIVASEGIFENPFAERRDLRWSVRSLNIYAVDLELQDLRKADFVTRMLKSVKASDDVPGYAFVIVSNSLARGSPGNIARFYPLRLDEGASTESCKP